MASSLNKVMLIGNLGKDAETRQTPNGISVTNFSLATTFRSKDQSSGEWRERTDWHDVVLWRGERVSQYLTKGRKVFVEGRLQTRSWEDQNGQKRYKTEVVCDSFGLMLLGSREGEGGSSGYSQGGSGGYSQSGDQGGYSQGSSSGYSQDRRQAPPSAPAAAEPKGAPAPIPDDDDIPF